MYIFDSNVDGSVVKIVLDCKKPSVEVLKKHLALGERKSEKFLINEINRYASIVLSGKDFTGESKNGVKYSVKLRKL